MGNAGSGDGDATDEEKALVLRFDRATPTETLQTHFATEAARALNVVQQAAPGLPNELQLAVAELAMMTDSLEMQGHGFCSCNTRATALHADWSAVDDAASIVCRACGKARSVMVRPALRVDGHRRALRPVHVRCAERAKFQPCRHFHTEGDERDDPIAEDAGHLRGCVAVRHRMSGLHSFRTVVCGEWVAEGTARYRVRFPQLTHPTAAGIGVVTTEANVNSEVAWCAGTRGWSNAWGLCVENEDASAGHSEIRALGAGNRAMFGGRGSASDSSDAALPTLNAGDVFDVEIDATRRTLTISKRDPDVGHVQPICMQIPSTVRPPRKHPELALAVALKFAGDSCRIDDWYRPIGRIAEGDQPRGGVILEEFQRAIDATRDAVGSESEASMHGDSGDETD